MIIEISKLEKNKLYALKVTKLLQNEFNTNFQLLVCDSCTYIIYGKKTFPIFYSDSQFADKLDNYIMKNLTFEI